MALWRDYYCELSPFEFRLYLNAEERTCCDNCSLLRCEEARVTSPEGRFELAFPGKRLYLRAANRGEAEDWVDRIVEAVNKCRPAPRTEEQWEVLQPVGENGVDERTSLPSSPERRSSSSDTGTCCAQEAPPPAQEFSWARTTDVEADTIKEAVLYLATDAEARTWTPLVFSLSLEALKGFRVQEGRKQMRLTHPIEEIRDVVPDVSLGGPDFFKLLTVRETLRLRAQSPEEARSWRVLIRGALDSYLESAEDGGSEDPAVLRVGVNGNLLRLVQYRLKEEGPLLGHLFTVPSDRGLDTQNFKCAGKDEDRAFLTLIQDETLSPVSCPPQAVLSPSARPGAEPGCVSSQVSTTVSPATAPTPPSFPHACCTTGTCCSERLAPHVKLLLNRVGLFSCMFQGAPKNWCFHILPPLHTP